MKSVLFSGKSEKSIELLIELAKQLGIKTKVLSQEEIEDAGLLKAIKKGRTGKFIDSDEFLKNLK